MNRDQGNAIIERIATVIITWLLTWATAKGYITTAQAAEYMPLFLGIITAAYGWWVTRPQSILTAAANIPEVKKVEMASTVEGKTLADSVTSSKVDT